MENKIRERRIQQGFTVEGLAKKVKISRSYMSQIETGARGRKMNYPLLARIARALDTTPDYLMNGDANGEETECLGSR
ncbi:helix-turn-helix domain-containing protein [Brevibacillus choshinensis]|uniref:helix-turn-helix domain-containing protein n=1 Tax=Brevibacillus choshinensis TaxID=54911 RepID=UPI00399D45CE